MIRFVFKPEDDQDNNYHTVILTKSGNDIDLDEVLELCKNFVLAMGYHPDNVQEYFSPPDDSSCTCKEPKNEEKEK